MRALGERSGAINAPRRYLLARILNVVGAKWNAGWAKLSGRVAMVNSLDTLPTDYSRLALDMGTLTKAGSCHGNAAPTGSTYLISTRGEAHWMAVPTNGRRLTRGGSPHEVLRTTAETPRPLVALSAWANTRPASCDIRTAHLGLGGGAAPVPCRIVASWIQFEGGTPRLGREIRTCWVDARALLTVLEFEGTAKCLGRQSTLGKAARRKGSMPRILTWHGRLPIMPNA